MSGSGDTGSMAPSEHDLRTLLPEMKPEIQDGTFVFCSFPKDSNVPFTTEPLLIFREREGITVVLRRGEAERLGLAYQFPSRLITLTVHSSLDAVGFLAAITARLAEAGIGESQNLDRIAAQIKFSPRCCDMSTGNSPRLV
jgi:hypothetical protein